jgi:Tol biopolymer transport system component
MNEERWRKVGEIFHAVLETPPESRSAFLDSACAHDPELRREVELLVAKAESAGSFLESPALGAPTVTVDSHSLAVGRQIGPYSVIAPLGAGGMGEVYRAHDEKLGRDVALKVLPSEFARDPDRLARFRREARTLASLNHPNIAAIYGLEESESVDVLVLELVEGENLRGPLSIATALDLAGQIAEALAAAHEKGIIHRDLKPANIKVTPEGRVKVLDFGLAKAIQGSETSPEATKTASPAGGATVAGHIVGTPGYMSPEQARGESVDRRTDVWAFGCILFELLSGSRAFAADTLAGTITAVLKSDPDWNALPPKLPVRVRELLRRCLEKDRSRRLAGLAEARVPLERALRGRNRVALLAAGAALVLLAAAAGLWLRTPPAESDRSQWVQMTRFTDSVTQPALSPDGKMVAFIRGDSSFVGQGQIYVKMLPDGDPVQLTHDKVPKSMPAFSPDGTRIAYTTYLDREFGWDTWSVPVLGGEPERWLKNASGLVWTGPGNVLFSEIKMGLHMGIVAADENRAGARSVYMPAGESCMAHRSYLSPDRKSVLLVEMDDDHTWLPCRLVPTDGSSTGHSVGPAGGGCTFGAWSPDGKWMYFTSNAVGGNHIWRQRFPDGPPQQLTSGPTAEEGIAMAPDGRSLVTAVALKSTSLRIHDAHGEREAVTDANAADPKFSSDGTKLFYRVVKEPPSERVFYRDAGEVRVMDVASGRSEPVVRGLAALDYDLSADDREIVLETAGDPGKTHIVLAPVDRSVPPRQIPGADGSFPRFGRPGEILFRRTEGSRAERTIGSIYRIHPDGSGMQKAFELPVLLMGPVSPDHRSLAVWAPIDGNGPPASQLIPLDGGAPLVVGAALGWSWSHDGASLSIASFFGAIMPESRSYVIPIKSGQSMPPVPPGGFRTEADIAGLPGARKLDDVGTIWLGPNRDVYANYRGAVQRNLYRIPLP